MEGLQTQTKEAKQYGALCHQFPSLVVLNGLQLTIAFFNSKSVHVNEKGAAYERYLNYLMQALEIDRWDTLRNCSSDQYRLYSRNAMKASVWFKRYAEATLKAEPTAEY